MGPPPTIPIRKHGTNSKSLVRHQRTTLVPMPPPPSHSPAVMATPRRLRGRRLLHLIRRRPRLDLGLPPCRKWAYPHGCHVRWKEYYHQSPRRLWYIFPSPSSPFDGRSSSTPTGSRVYPDPMMWAMDKREDLGRCNEIGWVSGTS